MTASGDAPNKRPTRLIGATLAILLWTPFAALLLLGGWSTDSPLAVLAVAGLLVTPAVGFLLAPRAAMSRGLGAMTAGLFALLAVSVGALAFGLFFAVLNRRDPFDAIGFAVVGVAFMGIPLLIIGFHAALLWVTLVRRLGPQPTP